MNLLDSFIRRFSLHRVDQTSAVESAAGRGINDEIRERASEQVSLTNSRKREATVERSTRRMHQVRVPFFLEPYRVVLCDVCSGAYIRIRYTPSSILAHT